MPFSRVPSFARRNKWGIGHSVSMLGYASCPWGGTPHLLALPSRPCARTYHGIHVIPWNGVVITAVVSHMIKPLPCCTKRSTYFSDKGKQPIMPVRVNIKSWSGLCCFSQRVTWSKPLVTSLGMHIIAVTVALIVTIVICHKWLTTSPNIQSNGRGPRICHIDVSHDSVAEPGVRIIL